MMRAMAAAVVLLLAAGPLRAAGQWPHVFRCDPQSLTAVRERLKNGDPRLAAAMAELRRRADRFLGDGPFAVTDKKHPAPSNDPHDYVSLAPYFWPNPKTADHLPYVRRDGRRNPQTGEYDAARFGAMSGHAHLLALTWYLSGDERYADRAALLLRTWFLDPATRMNPNLNYAQFIKGVNQGRGTGIIESARLLDVVDAVGLLRGSKVWTDRDRAGMEEWFGRYLDWMLQSKNGKAEAAAANNHGSWYDVQVVTYAMFTGRDAEARRVLDAAGPGRIARQIEPDGRQPRELKRTNSFGYSVFNLEALTELADLGERAGVDLWHFRTPDGRGIRAAIDFLVPYAAGEKPWPYQQISPMDAGGLIVPFRRAARAYHEPRYAALIGKLKEAKPAPQELLEFPPAE